MGDFDNEGGYVCMGAEDPWKIPEISNQFCCELKKAPKKSIKR